MFFSLQNFFIFFLLFELSRTYHISYIRQLAPHKLSAERRAR